MPAMSQVELPHVWNSTGDGVKRTDLEKTQRPAAPTCSLSSVAQVESLGTQLTDEANRLSASPRDDTPETLVPQLGAGAWHCQFG